MKWQIRVLDPSGDQRIISLAPSITIGQSPLADIPLYDSTYGGDIVLRRTNYSKQFPNVWLAVSESQPPVRIGDLFVRDALWPEGVPLTLGETRILLEKSCVETPLPLIPTGQRPWLTRSESGTKTLWITKKAAATPLSLYLAGETGTGKEVLAELAHAWSDRAAGPFVPLHCAALPIALIESELFGHVKGAFTGAVQQRPGALLCAHSGTLFLDEIGDLPMDIQIKLLRFLENGEIRPVGADRVSRADVRLVCATHKPLTKLIEEGKFRRDLYYRLASVTIDIPTLRSRPDDIELLAIRFASDLKRSLTRATIRRLQAHAWPGNVRELRHAVERAAGLAGPFVTQLDQEAFDFLLTPENITRTPALELGNHILRLNDMERIMILKALRLAQGNRTRAAETLGIARSTLFEMLKRHRISGPRAYAAQLEGRTPDVQDWQAAETEV